MLILFHATEALNCVALLHKSCCVTITQFSGSSRLGNKLLKHTYMYLKLFYSLHLVHIILVSHLC